MGPKGNTTEIVEILPVFFLFFRPSFVYEAEIRLFDNNVPPPPAPPPPPTHFRIINKLKHRFRAAGFGHRCSTDKKKSNLNEK
jgi:hypothetical protein